MKSVRNLPWIKKVLLGALLLAALFLRLYNLENNVMFQGDQGRDALLVSQIFKEKDPVFIGPVTSVGNMYLGPFYYYFMLPFLFLSYPSPLGPVYAVILLSVLTIYLLFQISRRLFNEKTAWMASLFYTFSLATITYARFSWNPNIAPFFGLLMFYFSYLALKKDFRYWALVTLMLSILIQLHYVALLSAAGAALVFLIQLLQIFRSKKEATFWKKWSRVFKTSFLAVFIFLASLVPLILFDFKHDFLNGRALLEFTTNSDAFNLEKKHPQEGFQTIRNFITLDLKDKSSQVLFEPSFGIDAINHSLLYLSAFILILYLIRKKQKLSAAELVLAAYLFTGILGIVFYQGNVYEHYFAYLFPFIYLFYALLFSKISNRYLSWGSFLIFFSLFLWKSWPLYPFSSNSWTVIDMQKASQIIFDKVKPGEKYNIVLLAESEDIYGMNYRYFLSSTDNPPLKLAEAGEAEALFIINEEKKQNRVEDLPIYEIVVFPNKDSSEVFQLPNGPEITILRVENTSYNEP